MVVLLATLKDKEHLLKMEISDQDKMQESLLTNSIKKVLGLYTTNLVVMQVVSHSHIFKLGVLQRQVLQ
jgi:hypothetical protein